MQAAPFKVSRVGKPLLPEHEPWKPGDELSVPAAENELLPTPIGSIKQVFFSYPSIKHHVEYENWLSFPPMDRPIS